MWAWVQSQIIMTSYCLDRNYGRPLKKPIGTPPLGPCSSEHHLLPLFLRLSQNPSIPPWRPFSSVRRPQNKPNNHRNLFPPFTRPPPPLLHPCIVSLIAICNIIYTSTSLRFFCKKHHHRGWYILQIYTEFIPSGPIHCRATDPASIVPPGLVSIALQNPQIMH